MMWCVDDVVSCADDVVSCADDVVSCADDVVSCAVARADEKLISARQHVCFSKK